MGILLVKNLKIRKNGDIYIQTADNNISPLSYRNDFWGNGLESFEKILKNFQDGYFRVNAIENNLSIIYLFLKRFKDKEIEKEEIEKLFLQLSKKEDKRYILKFYEKFLKNPRYSYKKGFSGNLIYSFYNIKALTINEANFLKELEPSFEVFNIENI